MSSTTAISLSINKPHWGPRSIGRHALVPSLLLLAACGGGGDSGPEVNSPLSTPMAFVVNQDDTTLTTVRLDGKASPVISTLSLGPAQADAIGGTTFSLGEWIFVTNKSTNKVAAIDPIGGLAPILETFLEVNGPVRLGQRPSRIYRDPVDKEVLWTMNEGDPVTGIDTLRPCPGGGSVSVLHNSHLSAGGAKPHVSTTTCLSGVGDHFIAFSRPPAVPQEIAFVSSKTTGLISLLLADPSYGVVRWGEIQIVKIDLCNSVKEAVLGHPPCDGTVTTANHSAPTGMFWSKATGKIYSNLSGYGTVVEIDPVSFTITRDIDIAPPGNTEYESVGMTPDGRFLWLVGEDIISDPTKAVGKFGVVDLTQPVLAVTALPVVGLDNIRPALFQFTPDDQRLYLTQSNSMVGLPFAAQAHALKKDRLLAFDTSGLPATIALIAEVDLPPADQHGMDLWITGPQGAGSAKGIVVTNATAGASGSVSLIDAASPTITATIPVGRNPKQVTVYYVGLAANDNQATPSW